MDPKYGLNKETCDMVVEGERLKGLDFDRVMICAPDVMFYMGNELVKTHRVVFDPSTDK
jgi:hypothetical protein